jgi:hypothetical protein
VQTGKIERLNRTLATDGPTARHIHWHRLTQHRFCPWLKHYNTVRRCSTLGTTVLISRLFINLVARYI